MEVAEERVGPKYTETHTRDVREEVTSAAEEEETMERDNNRPHHHSRTTHDSIADEDQRN